MSRLPPPLRRRRRLLGGLLGLLALLLTGVLAAYLQDMRAIRHRLQQASRLVLTAQGPVEIADWGSGPAVLVLHGAGGGHDQGRLLAQALGGDGLRWLAPSRFGYLRSPLPADASTAAQADTLAALMDALHIDRAAVLAISGGVPPALQLAHRHPDRVSALVLLSSAPYAPLVADEAARRVPTWVYQALFASDFPFWLLQRLWPAGLAALFDAPAPRQDRLAARERDFVAAMVGAFLPVTDRLPGVANEGAAIDPGARIDLGSLTTPALVVHAHDDGINDFAIGEHTAAALPQAGFLALRDGGHLLLGHHEALRMRINGFLHQHSSHSAR